MNCVLNLSAPGDSSRAIHFSSLVMTCWELRAKVLGRFRIRSWDYEPTPYPSQEGNGKDPVPRRTESADKSDALQTLRSSGRQRTTRQRLECVRLQRRLLKATADYFLPSSGKRFSTNGNLLVCPSISIVTDFSKMSMTRIGNVLVPTLNSPVSPFVNVRSLINATRRSGVPIIPLRSRDSFFVGSGAGTGATRRFGKNGSFP